MKLLKIVLSALAIVVGFVIVIIFVAVLKTENTSVESVKNVGDSVASISKKTEYVPISENLYNTLYLLLENDYTILISGGDSAIGDSGEYIAFHYPTAAKEFKTNEVRARKKYEGKKIVFRGIISAVEEGPFRGINIRFKGNNKFDWFTTDLVAANQSRLSKMVGKTDEEIAMNFNVGESIMMECGSVSITLGMIFLHECSPVNNIIDMYIKASHRLNSRTTFTKQYIEQNQKNKDIQSLTNSMYFIASQNAELTKECSTGLGPKCKKLFDSTVESIKETDITLDSTSSSKE